MAFPIPAHLPRKPTPQDVSTQILTKIDAAAPKTLNSALATSWLEELDQTIQTTKEKIHERVQRDRPTFDRQLASAQSVQTRLQTLTTQVEFLRHTVSNPETGLIPTLVRNLKKHAELEQETLDASIAFDTLSRLHQFKKTFTFLESLIEAGKLADAAGVCRQLHGLLQETPQYLNETEVVRDLRAKFRAAQSRNEEQLSDSYTRGIVISQNEFIICPHVQVRKSTTSLSLPSILYSLSGTFLTNHLTTLRRDLTIHYIERLLKQSVSVSLTSTKYKTSLHISLPDDEALPTRLENLSTVFTFLSSHLFPALPPLERVSFPRSLCKSTTTSLLNNLLIPALPASFDKLPVFLELVQKCVAFETKYLVEVFGGDATDRPIKIWADGLSGHYERQRRLLILDRAREIVVSKDSRADVFFVEVEVVSAEVAPSDTPIPEVPEPIAKAKEHLAENVEVKDDAWGFDDGLDSGNMVSFGVEEDSWGFDDDILEPEPEPEPMIEPQPTPPEPAPHSSPGGSASPSDLINSDDEPDPSEAWGWNEDNNEEPAEESVWDDPWANEPAAVEPTVVESRPPPAPSIPPAPAPKAATRLEKLANKGKKHANGTASTSPLSPKVLSPKPSPQPFPAAQLSAPSSTQHSRSVPTLESERPPPIIKHGTIKESYSVSSRMKQIISLVEDVLSEGTQFAISKLISQSPSSSSSPGTTILLSAPSIFDFYRALYPLKFVDKVALPGNGMQFSNDCLYLIGEVERIQKGLSGNTKEVVRERFTECAKVFKVLSESWYHDIIREHQQSIHKTLKEGAQGFTYTGDQDRYDECETAVVQTLQAIRRFAQGVKDILAKSKYYTAIGMVTNAALSKILLDVLALPDIPEVESHRLSELCKILHAVEGLFVEDPEQPSFIAAYVPSWLKFSYLSELLDSSMADITYLFEVRALVDFQIDELVRLVRALFSDTPLRANTINKLLEGHPVAAS